MIDNEFSQKKRCTADFFWTQFRTARDRQMMSFHLSTSVSSSLSRLVSFPNQPQVGWENDRASLPFLVELNPLLIWISSYEYDGKQKGFDSHNSAERLTVRWYTASHIRSIA